MAALSPLLRSFDLGCGHPGAVQEGVFRSLLKAGRDTAFGNEHGFGEIRDYREFVRRVPVRESKQFAPYIERLRRGDNYVLWNQKVRCFAKASATISDTSKCHQVLPAALSARQDGASLWNGQARNLGVSRKVDELSGGGARDGDLSASLLSNSPSVAEIVRTPSRKIAMLPDFRQKIEGICRVC